VDDLPTGPIPAATLTRIIEETRGTGGSGDASNSDVNPPGLGETGEPVHRGREGDPLDPLLDRVLADRQALIQLCLYALDRARSGGVVERIEQGLAGIGVVAMRPDGQRFDPAVHEAGGTVVTDDPARDGLVAETEVVGFADQDRLLRAPVVMVYKKR
jgi:molecular chaperone GrpE